MPAWWLVLPHETNMLGGNGVGFAGLVRAAEVTVKPAGLQVVWDDGHKAFGGFRTFNSQPGVQVSFLLESDGASFIDVDDDACSVKIGGEEADCLVFRSAKRVVRGRQEAAAQVFCGRERRPRPERCR
jgi:hypothetical protein